MALETVGQIWDDLFSYWQQNEPHFTMCKGAGEEEIKSLETSLCVELPNSLKESLKRCNAYPETSQKIKNSSCLLTGGAGKLFNVEEINESYQEMSLYKFFEGEAMPYEHVDNGLETSTRWSEHFIPFYSWNCDVFALLDLRPNSNNYGQVLFEYPESSTLGIWAKSYEEFLQLIADAVIDHGAFNNNDMDKAWQKIYDQTRDK